MLIRLLLLVLSFTVGGAKSSAQGEYDARLIPPALTSGAGSCVRAYHHTFELDNDRSGTVKVRQVITLLNNDHDGDNRLVVYYDDESKVTSCTATLYDAFGQKVRSAKKSEIEDVKVEGPSTFISDSRVRTVRVDYLTYPYTVEFEYVKKIKDFGVVNEFPRWRAVDYDQSLQDATYTVLLPQDNELDYWSNELPEPEIALEDGKRKYVWAVSDISASAYESESPAAAHVLPYLMASPRRFTVGDYTGSLSSWGAYGKFMSQLIADRQAMPEALRAEVTSVTAGLTTDREKIDALYRMMQGRTRYVGIQLGIGGWQPFSPEFVEKNSYGDCKALSNYMGAMLREAGIESYPVLIDWNEDERFTAYDEFPSTMFNHMVLYVPAEDMYLECTSSDAPTGYLGEGKEDRHVVWITPEGGKLVKTPALEPTENGYTRSVRLELTTEGKTAYRQRTKFYGASQEVLRSLAAYEADPGKLKELLHQRHYLPDVQGESQLTVNPNAPTAELTYQTELPNYARKRGTRMFVSVNKFDPWEWVPDQVDERTQPVHSSLTRLYVDTIQLVLPQNMEVESLGDPELTLEHPVGEYRAEVSVAGNVLTWVRTFKLVPVKLPAAGYDDYRQFFVDVSKAEKRRVVLRERRTK